MIIKTQLGELKVVESGDSDFPGFHIYLNGELVSITEVNEKNRNILRTILYSPDEEEPQMIFSYKKRKDD